MSLPGRDGNEYLPKGLSLLRHAAGGAMLDPGQIMSPAYRSGEYIAQTARRGGLTGLNDLQTLKSPAGLASSIQRGRSTE